MKNPFRNINSRWYGLRRMIVPLVAPLLFAACSGDSDVQSPLDSKEAMLVLRTETIGQVRSGDTQTPDAELMHSLRIVVLHPDGSVEHNAYIPFQNGREEYMYVLNVKPDEGKRIYLIANEESVETVEGTSMDGTSLHAMLENIGIGATDFEEAINRIYFKPDYARNIPMTSMYEIEAVPAGKRIEKQMYVVRVATKFSVTFENERIGEDVQVQSFSIASLADKNYLMPHVGESQSTLNGLFWIDWLKEVADKSNVDPNNPSADESGWLVDYELPAAASLTEVYKYENSFTVNKPDVDFKAGTKTITGIYVPESKCLKADAPTIAGEQEYTMEILLKSQTDTDFHKLTATIPNLRALFRNTHVKVHVRFGNKADEDAIYARIVEWDPMDWVSGKLIEEKNVRAL